MGVKRLFTKIALAIISVAMLFCGVVGVLSNAKPVMAETQPVAPEEITATYDWYVGQSTYEIDSVSDLVGLAKLTQGAVAEAGTNSATNFAGQTVKLTANITFADNQYWYYNDANGTVYDYRILDFAGVFDGAVEGGAEGQTYTITGLQFYKKQNKQFNLGLFSSITTMGCVKNLTINNVDAITFGGWGSQTRIGSIAHSLYGKAENCHVDDVKYIVNDGYLDNSGGIFGDVYNNAEVKRCSVKNVSISITGSDNGQYVGGFVGGISSNTGDGIARSTSISDCSVENVYFDCTYKLKRFGGFVGYSNNTTVTNCTATNINFDVDDYVYVVGGFVGMAAVNSNYNNCDVIGTTMDLSRETSGPTRVGGFCGTVSNGGATNSTFVGCNVSDIDITMHVKVQSDIGGFLGYSDSPAYIDNCSAVGKIDATDTTKESLSVGGFIGSTTKTTTIKNSYADVDVNATADAGGFAGDASNLTIENSHARGDVTASDGSAGGFAGLSNGSTLTGCTASGSVTSTNGVAGGMIGYTTPNADITFSDCTPSTEVSGVITNEVANAPDKNYNIDSNGTISFSTLTYLCYGNLGGANIGFYSIQDAVDLGANSITLLANFEEDFVLKGVTGEVFTFNLGEFTYNGTITFKQNIQLTIKGTSVGNNIILGETTRNNYIFGGWYTDPEFTEGNEVINNTITSVVATGTTYYTKWTESGYQDLSETQLTFDFGSMVYGGTLPDSKQLSFVWEGEGEPSIYSVQESEYFETSCNGLTVNVCPKANLNAGVYEQSLLVKMHDGATVTIIAKLIVEKSTLDLSSIVFADKTVKYDGQSYSIEVVGTLPNDITVEYINNGQTDVGVYTITANFKYNEANYNAIAPLTATLTINSAQLGGLINESGAPTVIITSEKGFAPNVESSISQIDVGNVETGESVKENEAIESVIDISLVSNGNKIQPDGIITIKLLIPTALKDKEFRLIHNHEGTFTDVEYAIDGDYVVFDTDKLSEFLFVYDDTADLNWITYTLGAVIGVQIILAIICFIIIKKKGGKPGKPTSGVLVAMLSMLFFRGSYVASETIAVLVTLGTIVLGMGVLNVILILSVKKACKKTTAVIKLESVAETDKKAMAEIVGKVDDMAVAENEDIGLAVRSGEQVLVRFNRSFTARVIQSSDQTKKFYVDVKNYLLSFKEVKCRVGWRVATFTLGRVQLVKLNIRGKTLNINVALNPEDYAGAKFKVYDRSATKAYVNVPLNYKIRSKRSLNNAKKLIDDLAVIYELEKDVNLNINSVDDYPFETTKALIERGLVKVKSISGEEITDLEKVVSKPFAIHQSVTAEEARAEISDEVAMSLIIEGSKTVSAGKKFVVNIDVLSANFNSGDTVNIDALKEKGIVPKGESAIKILARGGLDKALTVVADAYSADAVKMIVLVGGVAKLK